MMISVVIPTYKRPGMLGRAIDSVLNQTYSNFEVIVVDDNNPNTEYRLETEKFMEKYSDNEKIRYIKREVNGGGSAARNTGIDNAKGEVVAFLDDDDEFTKNNLELQLKNLLDNNLDVSVCSLAVKDENGKVSLKKSYEDYDDYEDKMVYHITKMIVGTPTFMVRKEILKKVDGFSIVPSGQEYILMYKMIEADAKVGVLNEYLTIANVHSKERITVGKNKIDGEKLLYDKKKKYFNRLSFAQKKNVKYRYHSITFETYKKIGNNKMFLFHFLMSFVVRPIFILKRLLKKIATMYRKQVSR